MNGIAIMMLEGFFSKLDHQLYEFIKQEKRYHNRVSRKAFFHRFRIT